MKNGCLWLFLYSIAVVPAALLGGDFAGGIFYGYDHEHRPRLSNEAYFAMLNGWEVVGAVLCGLPGFVLVGWSHLKSRREDVKPPATYQSNPINDDTVWPPPSQE